ncbi:carbohydrate esterase family 4 protein [Mycena pura]|uniref:Carbohydrate esterase family 4 protein n=1 Tax=Mycena pura TaxID=153505 RepID=A0AAD6YHH3_9AGAR|nr:carbohydrate esterase family 4 protein [Mycena pura]
MFTKTFAPLLLPLLLSLAQWSGASTPRAIVYTSCVVPRTAALTFDDGPYIYMTTISDLLTSKGAKGTFFTETTVGLSQAASNAESLPDDCIYGSKTVARLQHAYGQGHQIASHTWSHPNLDDLNATQITEEFMRIDVALKKILGIQTSFLRPPYGNYNNQVREVAYQLNKTLVTWDFDSQDSLGATPQQSESYYDQAIASSVKTLLALNHETINTTAETLAGYAIDKLQGAGYTLVTVAECLELPPYTVVGTPGQRDETWVCSKKGDKGKRED